MTYVVWYLCLVLGHESKYANEFHASTRFKGHDYCEGCWRCNECVFMIPNEPGNWECE